MLEEPRVTKSVRLSLGTVERLQTQCDRIEREEGLQVRPSALIRKAVHDYLDSMEKLHGKGKAKGKGRRKR